VPVVNVKDFLQALVIAKVGERT